MASKKTFTQKEWEKKLNEVPVSKEDLNRLIMDYLVIEGYKDAAQRFSSETGINPQVDLESIENRMIIRSAIQRGDVEDAIGRVNELDPERLIELIRTGNITDALRFASEELAPRAEEHPNLLPELEKTMALLAFELPASITAQQQRSNGSDARALTSTPARKTAGMALEAPAHIVDLLSPAQRLRTAGELNAAILTSQSQGREPKLPQLLRMLTHGESVLASEGKVTSFPRLDLMGAIPLAAKSV